MIYGTLLAAAAVFSSAQPIGRFKPSTFSYKDLADSEAFAGKLEAFMDTLVADGMLQIADIPGYHQQRVAVLGGAHACSVSEHTTAKASVLEDGTQRRTLATPTSMLTGAQGFSAGKSESCFKFESAASEFRSVVDMVSGAFAERLSEELNGKLAKPVLKNKDGADFERVADVVKHGAHLDHFHSYKAPQTRTLAKSIEFHTDQGLFIALAPPLMVRDADGQASGSPAGELIVRTRSGHEMPLEMDPNSLVFMLGDGVEQFINPGLLEHTTPLYAVPHAMRMPETSKQESRVWFGRMFLPPDSAVRPDTGVTYKQLKKLTVEAQLAGDADDIETTLSLGCSRGLSTGRMLLEDACNSSQIYCWHRCMDYTPTANPDHCESQSSGFNCTSDAWDEIYLPKDGHGAYSPRCTNSTTLVQPIPTIAPAADTCTFKDDIAQTITTGGWTHGRELLADSSYLLWKIDGSAIDLAFAQVGKVGWMSLGLAKAGGKHNGMNGAHIMLGIVGSSEDMLRLEEMKIHEDISSYDAWTKLKNTASSKSMTITGCGAVMQFKSSEIGGWSFNPSGTDDLIFAVDKHHQGIYKTFRDTDYIFYHGNQKFGTGARLRFNHTWAHSEFTASALKSTLSGEMSSTGTEDIFSGATSTPSSVFLPLLLALVSMSLGVI